MAPEPTDKELDALWDKKAAYFALYAEARRFGRAIWALRTGTPAIQPVPVNERLPLHLAGEKVKIKAGPDPVYLVAIVVNDNDYYSTFYNLLETVVRVLKWKPKTSKEHIEYLIKQGIKFHYLAFQATEESNLEARESYLLKKVQILFNEEAQKDIDTKDHDHGAWYLVTHSSLINSY